MSDLNRFVNPEVLVGNAADREVVVDYDSMPYKFAPHEIKPITARTDVERNDFGTPKISETSTATGPDGRPIKSQGALTIKKGGEVQWVVNRLLQHPALYLVTKDAARDAKAEATARAEWLREHLADCRRLKSFWLANRLPNDIMPAHVFEADQDIARYADQAAPDQKRYLVMPDGTSWDYLEDAREHLIHPTRFPEYKETWLHHIRDRQGGPHAVKPGSTASVAPAPAGPSAAVASILKQAEKAGVVIPDALVVAMDNPETAEGAVEEAMLLIYNGPKEEKKGRGRKTAA